MVKLLPASLLLHGFFFFSVGLFECIIERVVVQQQICKGLHFFLTSASGIRGDISLLFTAGNVSCFARITYSQKTRVLRLSLGRHRHCSS